MHLQNTLNSKTTKNFTNFMFHSEVMTWDHVSFDGDVLFVP